MHLQVPAEGGAVDETGVEEAIVPTDMNLLTGHWSFFQAAKSNVFGSRFKLDIEIVKNVIFV